MLTVVLATNSGICLINGSLVDWYVIRCRWLGSGTGMAGMTLGAVLGQPTITLVVQYRRALSAGVIVGAERGGA